MMKIQSDDDRPKRTAKPSRSREKRTLPKDLANLLVQLRQKSTDEDAIEQVRLVSPLVSRSGYYLLLV